jgi:hypothetical protein
MTDFTEDFEVPEDAPLARPVPKKLANEGAFYTSELSSEDPIIDSQIISNDLEVQGTSPRYEEALSRWSEIQEFTNREAAIDIISDPTVDVATKSVVVRNFGEGKFTSNNLRDQYIQETGAKDVLFDGEDFLSQEDISAQEIFLNKIEDNLNFSDEVQKMKTSFGASLSGSTEGAVGGLIAEVLSPLDLHAIRSLYNASDLGIQVTNEDVLGGEETRLGVSIDPDDDSLVSKIFFGLTKAFETVISPLDGALFDAPRNFLFSGTLNKKVADLYEQSTPEQQLEILSKVISSLDDIPGTDFQKWLVFQEQIELGAQDPLAAAAGDLAGFIGASGAAAFFRNPVKGVKWYTTFEGSGLPSFTVGSKQQPATINVVDNSPDISTKANDIVKPDHVPTGKGEFNATDSIIVSTEDIKDVPTQGIAREVDTFLAKAGETYTVMKTKTADKVFDQSKASVDKGNIVVHLDPAEVEKKLPPVKVKEEDVKQAKELLFGKNEIALRIIAGKIGLKVDDVASKDMLDVVARGMADRATRIEKSGTFKEADKAFVSSNRVEVKEAKIADDGNFSAIDMVQYNVMRSNGMDSIPVSMGLDSVINATKNGLVKSIPSQPTIFDVASLTRMARPGIDPNSPAGILSRANPVVAANKHIDAIVDTSENTARHLGTTRGDIVADSVLPKLDIALEETFPNIANNLRKIDEEFESVIRDSGVDLLADKKVRDAQARTFINTLTEQSTGIYNQANSTVHIGKNKASGLATYGRNNNYGWNERAQAESVKQRLLEHNPEFKTRVVERNGSFWVEQEWNANFNHLDRWMFDIHSMDSSVIGINTSFLTREQLGSWIFPNAMKGNPDVAKVGFLAELKANNNEAKFFSLIRKEILDTPHKRQLAKLMNRTQEQQRWFKPSELAVEFPELNKKQVEELAKSYYAYKRGSDYAYELANTVHHRELSSQGYSGVYNANGDILAYGKETTRRPPEVFDFNKGDGVSTPKELNGATIIELNSPVSVDGKMYKHAILSGDESLGSLPRRTLPKVEGWIPRKNKENWFIEFTPNRLVIDGEEIIDATELAKHSRVVGAGGTLDEATKFSGVLSKEYSGGSLRVREAVENQGDAGLTDYQIYRDTTRNIKKRSDRLRTLHGFSQLEDPLEAFAETTRTLTRLHAWQPFKDSFEKSFMKFADDFVPTINGQKTFPNDVTALMRKEASSPEDMKRFKVAQRLLEQYKEMQYTRTAGDKVWRSTFNTIANTLEDVKWGGREKADILREIGKTGNLLVRVPKALASHMFIYMNPPRQWLIQPQQLLELNAISPTYASRAPTEVPAIISAVVSRAPHLKEYKGFDKVSYEAAKRVSLMNGKEFDDIVNAVYSSGLPQAVDLNQMLYGTWASSRFDIDPSKARQAVDTAINVVSSPGKFGKTIGYTPAEMANNIGTWLFTLDRWKKNNPGKNWNTPENIARITADSWDINHSMIGRAGAMPFQNGALGVLFQFMAVQQKGFMQLLSSKTLTKAEKAKLASARIALYGGYGIPMGAVGLTFLDSFMDENASEEVRQSYHQNKGGLADALANTALDVMFAEPGTEWEIVGDAFKGKLEGRSDITMSKVLTPVPDGFPLFDMLKELSNYTDNDKTNPRFPGPQAFNSLSKAVTDIQSLWSAETIDSHDKLTLAMQGLAETASLFNNYGKAVTMKQIGDKTSKLGTRYGIDVTEAEIFAQKMGFTTREEELMWRVFKLDKERTQHISNIANEVFERFTKMERILGQPEYEQAVSRLNEMLELSIEPEDVEEVRRLVDNKIEAEFKKGTIKSSLYESVFNFHRNLNNDKHKEMIGLIRQSAATNEGDARIVEMLENAGIIERE